MGLPDCLQEVGQGRRPICVPCLLEREGGIASGNCLTRGQLLTVDFGTYSPFCRAAAGRSVIGGAAELKSPLDQGSHPLALPISTSWRAAPRPQGTMAGPSNRPSAMPAMQSAIHRVAFKAPDQQQ